MQRGFIPAALAALVAVTTQPAFAQEAPPEYRDRAEAREAYQRGYERGFERGYEKGRTEGERRAASAPPPAPPPPKLGPIYIIGARYGTDSHNCDATRWLSRRANGKRSDSFEVTNAICGDPARGDRKSLEVEYRCGDVRKTASAFEHRTIYLSCGS